MRRSRKQKTEAKREKKISSILADMLIESNRILNDWITRGYLEPGWADNVRIEDIKTI